MSASTLLSRLDNVRQTAPCRWVARCPAHDDRSPSLSVRELDDGRVLLHDFGGCETEAVLAAIGLTLGDLFARPLGEFSASRTAMPARDLLVMLDHEVIVAVLILNDVVQRRAVTEPQVRRLMQAASRIGAARDMVNPIKVSHAA
jgi:hypothetical protein